jgi:hypothetical protein
MENTNFNTATLEENTGITTKGNETIERPNEIKIETNTDKNPIPNTANSTSEQIFIDPEKIAELKSLKSLDDFLDFMIKYENEKVDKLLEFIFGEINPYKTHQISKKKKKKILLQNQNLKGVENINQDGEGVNRKNSDKEKIEISEKNTNSTKEGVEINEVLSPSESSSNISILSNVSNLSKPSQQKTPYTIFGKFYHYFPKPLTEEEIILNPPTDELKKKFKFLLTKFFLDFFITLDNREKIFLKVIKNSKINSHLINIFNLAKKYKLKKNLFITFDKRIKNQAIDSLTKINYQYIKEFMDIFDLKEIFYLTAPAGSTHIGGGKNSKVTKVKEEKKNTLNNSKKSVNPVPNQPIIVNIINNMIYSLNQNKGADKVVKFIEFSLKYNSDEKILPTEELKSQIDVDCLFEICIKDKALFGVVKKVLRIFPEKSEDLVYYYLRMNDTKQASDLAKDKEFRNFISQETVDTIIYKAYIKCACYHYNRYYTYEIDIEQLYEMFSDKTEVLSFLANKFCKENLMQECYYIFKASGFDTKSIKLEPNLEKEFKYFLVSSYDEERDKKKSRGSFVNSSIQSIQGDKSNGNNGKPLSKNKKNKNSGFVINSYDSIYHVEPEMKGMSINNTFNKNKNSKPLNSVQGFSNQNEFFSANPKFDQKELIYAPKITDSFTPEFLKIFIDNEKINIKYNDYFGPVTQQCIKLELDVGCVHFVDCAESLEKISHHLKIGETNSSPSSKHTSHLDIVGIDFEWKSKACPLEKDEGVSIMQISTREKVFVFDVFKINSQPEFMTKFSELFKNKTFLGFGFKADIANLTNEIKNFFLNCKFLDIPEIYKKKFNTPCPNLSELCKKILSKELCKGEQVSNWERRPLRKRQLHYAALDAYILLKIYEKLNHSE